MKRLTTEQFIDKAKKFHNNFYNYSLTNYTTAQQAEKNNINLLIIKYDENVEKNKSLSIKSWTFFVFCFIIFYMQNIKTLKEALGIAESLTRRKIYKTKVSFICENCGIKTEVALRQFKERGKNKLICQKCETKNKLIQKYGVDNIFKSKEFVEKNTKNNLKIEKILEICEKNNLDFLDEYTGVHNADGSWKYYNVKCKKCNKKFKTYFHEYAKNTCPVCFPKNISQGEKEIKEFIKSIYTGRVVSNDREVLKGKELDIYLPDLKIAIEYDGVYWHNNINNYFKYEECKTKGIKLIHIIENTWLQKKDIVKSVLKTYLGFEPKKYYARKCKVKEIDDKTYKKFCEENHLQGYSTASVKLGLYSDSELVQIMSFSNFDKTIEEYEIIRECSKINCGIIGGKQKLLKYFERKYSPKGIISYCWKDYFSGESYINSGFILIKETAPNCFYTKNNLSPLKSRKNLKEGFSEYENIKNDSYLKIFDYGSFVFKK